MCNFYILGFLILQFLTFPIRINTSVDAKRLEERRKSFNSIFDAIIRDSRRIGREIAIYSQTDSRRDGVWHRIASRAPRREIVYIIHADMWMCLPAAAADGRALF